MKYISKCINEYTILLKTRNVYVGHRCLYKLCRAQNRPLIPKCDLGLEFWSFCKFTC